MNYNKIVSLPKEYDKNEPISSLLENCLMINLTERSINQCPLPKVRDAVIIIGDTWGLRPNRPNEFKTIKKILINSVKNN